MTAPSLEPYRERTIMMAKLEDGRIVETPTEARQAERGPSVLVLLAVSLVLAVIVMGVAWTIFFKS
jgi:hypothetical protein